MYEKTVTLDEGDVEGWMLVCMGKFSVFIHDRNIH